MRDLARSGELLLIRALKRTLRYSHNSDRFRWRGEAKISRSRSRTKNRDEARFFVPSELGLEGNLKQFGPDTAYKL